MTPAKQGRTHGGRQRIRSIKRTAGDTQKRHGDDELVVLVEEERKDGRPIPLLSSLHPREGESQFAWSSSSIPLPTFPHLPRKSYTGVGTAASRPLASSDGPTAAEEEKEEEGGKLCESHKREANVRRWRRQGGERKEHASCRSCGGGCGDGCFLWFSNAKKEEEEDKDDIGSSSSLSSSSFFFFGGGIVFFSRLVGCFGKPRDTHGTYEGGRAYLTR